MIVRILLAKCSVLNQYVGKQWIAFILILGMSSGVYAQFSPVHYLPTPINETQWGVDMPTYRLTSLSSSPVNVTVTNSATGALLTTLTIPPNGEVLWDSPYETAAGFLTPDDLGVKMEATEDFSVTGFGDLGTSTMALSWVSKGLTGLGRDFRLYGPPMNFRGSANGGNYYSIVAAEDATVTVSGLPAGNGTYMLMEGQTIVIDGGTNPDESLYSGAMIVSTGDIAVLNQTNQFFNGAPNANSGGSDDGADMLVPTNALARDFLVVIGRSTEAREIVTIVATEDNTEVILNGVVIDTIDDGEHLDLSGNDWDDSGVESFMDIQTSNKSYVWHKTSSGAQDGYVLIPGQNPLNQQMIAVVPSTQFADAQYTVVTEAGSTLTLDGVVQTPAFTSGGLEVYVIASSTLGGAPHVVESTSAINVTALSFFGQAAVGTSYGGFGGARLELINQGESTVISDFDMDSDGRADTCFLYIVPDAFPSYQWSFNGVPIAGETDYYTTVDMEGVYSVLVTTANGDMETLEFETNLMNTRCIDACGLTAEFGDFDCDGILNIDDIDDDNDGIPDLEECGGLQEVNIAPDGSFESLAAVASSALQNSNITASGWINSASNGCDSWLAPVGPSSTGYCSGVANPSPEGGVFVGGRTTRNFGDGTEESFRTTLNGLTIGAEYTISFYQINAGREGGSPATIMTQVGDRGFWTVEFGGVRQYSDTLAFQGFGNQTWQQERVELTFTATSTSQNLEFFPTKDLSQSPRSNTIYMGIDGIQLLEGASTCEDDTDGDGILNVFDLDSDNDRCPDAVEAGHGQPLLPNDMVDAPVLGNGLPNVVASPAPDTNEINYTIETTPAGDYAFLIDSVRTSDCPSPVVDTICDTVAYDESVTICFEVDPLVLFPTTVQQCSPTSVASTSMLGSPDDTCAIITGLIPGVDTLCFVVCDDSLPSFCDTTYVFLKIIDTIGPELSCKVMGDSVYLDGNGVAIIDTSHVLDSVSDISGVDSVWLSDTLFMCADTGTQMVTVYARDIHGNVDSCLTSVMVLDTIAPMIVCQSPVNLFLDALGMVMIDTSELIMSLSDACGIDSVWVSDMDGMLGCDDAGTSSITVFAMDVSGNIDSCSSMITVIDTIAPEISCLFSDTLLYGCDTSVANGNLFTSIDTMDLCGVDSVWYEDVAFLTSCRDSIIRTWYAQDEGGNRDSCNQTLVVIDTTSPMAICLFSDTLLYGCDTSVANASTLQSVSVSGIDICGVDSIWNLDVVFLTSCRDSISRTWMVRDSCGNLASCMQGIAIVDTTSPMITCPPNASDSLIVFQTGRAGPDRYGFATATDECGVESIIHSDDTILAGSGCSPIIFRTWIATDSCGNVDSCEQRITYGDMTPPVITCPADTLITCDASSDTSSTGAAMATDNVGVETITFSDTNIEGGLVDTIRRTWIAMDSCGLFDTCIQDITIVDTTAPMISCMSPLTFYLDANGMLAFDTSDVIIDVSDECVLDSVWLSDIDGMYTCADTGTQTLRVYAMDASGNVDSCESVIIVLDTILPVVSCMDITVYLDSAGRVVIDSSDVINVMSAGCGLRSIVLSDTLFECVDTGVNQVTVTVTTLSGAMTTCIAQVTVLDTVAPEIECMSATFYLDQTGMVTIDTGQVIASMSDACGVDSVWVDDVDGMYSCTDTGTQMLMVFIRDVSGNENTCQASITVLDTIAPVITCPAMGASVSCDSVPPDTAVTGVPTAVENCGTVTYSFTDEFVHGGCEDTIRRTWVVMDGSGNSDSCVQSILLIDTVPPMFSIGDDTITITCGGVKPALPTYTIMDNCGLLQVDTVIAETFPDLQSGYVRTVMYIGIDSCDNRDTVTQTAIFETRIPTLTLGNLRCNSSDGTYFFEFVSDADSVVPNVGMVNGNRIEGVALGDTVMVRASNGLGCETTITVIGPATCSDQCAYPELIVGNGVCIGASEYAVSYSEGTGATIMVSDGTDQGGSALGSIGTDIMITASHDPDCEVSYVVQSPADCGDSCGNARISVSGPVCSADGSETYELNYVAHPAAIISSTEGVVAADQITDIPSGVAVTLLVEIPGCSETDYTYEGIECPECENPMLNVGGFKCSSVDGTYSLEITTNADTILVSSGTVEGDSMIIDIPLGDLVEIEAMNGSDCITKTSFQGPATCSDQCAYPELSAGNGVCEGAGTYSISITEGTGATITVDNGSLIGNVVVGATLGMPTTVTASHGPDCEVSYVVESPEDCSDPCKMPKLSIGGASCAADGSEFYEVNFRVRPGAMVTSSVGNVGDSIVTMVPSGQDVELYIEFSGCANDTIVIRGTQCPECVNPLLTVGGFRCNNADGTYSLEVVSNADSILVSSGSVEGDSMIVDIPLGDLVEIEAKNGIDCITKTSFQGPTVCSDSCAYPELIVGNGVCEGTGGTYSISISESTGATITVDNGTLSGNLITGAIIGMSTTITASHGPNCEISYTVESPEDCSDPCRMPKLSIGGAECADDGSAFYQVNFQARPGAVVTSSAGVVGANMVSMIPSGIDVELYVAFSGCESDTILIPASDCPECDNPMLTVGGFRCNSADGTYSLQLTTNADTLMASSGTIQGDSMIVDIPLGDLVEIEAMNGADCITKTSFQGPATCSDQCAYPELSVGNAICEGTGGTYSISITETTGATITVDNGTLSGSLVVGATIGMPTTITASHGPDCEISYVVESPEDCSDPCKMPKLSIGGVSCATDGSEFYEVNFRARPGAAVTSNAGVVSDSTVSMVPSGTDVELYVEFSGCGNDTIVIKGTSCPECDNPMLTVGGFRCNSGDGTYSLEITTNANTLVASSGMVQGDSMIIDIPLGTLVEIEAMNGSDCITQTNFQGPATCSDLCAYPELSVGNAICEGTGGTYSISITENTGATITVDNGTLSGNAITGATIGMPTTITASHSPDCEISYTVESPEDCSDPCKMPKVSVGGVSCAADGSEFYEVNFVARPGATVTSSAGAVGADAITMVPSGMDVELYIEFSGCENDTITIKGSQCPECDNPVLTVGGFRCNSADGTYSVELTTNADSVRVSSGMVEGDSVIVGIPLGSLVEIEAINGLDCITKTSFQGPATCSDQCAYPELSVGNGVCEGTGGTYSISISETSGATISVDNGVLSGNVVIGATIGMPTTITASHGPDCEISYTVESPEDCSDPCQMPKVSVGGVSCADDGSEFYMVHFRARPGVVITSSAGVVGDSTVSMIPSGQDIQLFVEFSGCGSDTIDIKGSQCPECDNPLLTVGGFRCNGADGTYSVVLTTNADSVVVSSGSVEGDSMIVDIPLGDLVEIEAMNGTDCITKTSFQGPATCSDQCAYPELSVGNGICEGTGGTYTISISESTNAMITVDNGTLIGNVVVGATIGMPTTITASHGPDCEISYVVESPEDCSDPCKMPKVSIGGVTCANDGSAFYEVNFRARPGAVVRSSEGVVTDSLVTMVPSGTDVELYISFSGCDNDTVLIKSTECPECTDPYLTVGDFVCNAFAGTYSLSLSTDATSIMNVGGGTLVGNSEIVDVPLGTDLSVVATNNSCTTQIDFEAPASCSDQCAYPKLNVGNAVCEGTSGTYSFSFTETTGADLSVDNGTIMGNMVVGATIGTPTRITAMNSPDCEISFVVQSPEDCSDPCARAKISIGGTQCEGDESEFYQVNISPRPGATVTSSTGVVTDTAITMVQSGVDVEIYVAFSGCDTDTITVTSDDCPECVDPLLTVSGFRCNSATGTFSLNINTNGDSVSVSAGTLQGDTMVVDVPMGMILEVMAINGTNCIAQVDFMSPASCSDQCAYPQLSVGNGVCDGSSGTYSISFTERSGAQLTASQGTIIGNTVVGALVGTPTTITARHDPDCEISYVIQSPVDCSDPCKTQKASIGGTSCSVDGPYFEIAISARPGAIITASHGIVTDSGVVMIPSGENVDIQIAFNGCETDSFTVGCLECPPCHNPMLSVGYMDCDAMAGTYDLIVNTEDSVTLSANFGVFDGRVLRGIPLGDTAIVTSSRPANCATVMRYLGPASCPDDCDMPALTVGQAICQGSGSQYMVSFSEPLGSMISVNAGTVSGSSVIDVPIGMDLVITATNGACVLSVIVTSPEDCTDRCANPGLSISGPQCSADGMQEYILNYVASPGVTVISDAGIIGAAQITNIPQSQDVVIQSYLSGCDTVTMTFGAPMIDTVTMFLGRDTICVSDGIQLNVSSYNIAGGFIPGSWSALDAMTGMELPGMFTSTNFANGNEDTAAVWVPGAEITGDTTICFVWVQDYENERCQVEVDTYKVRLTPAAMIMVGGDTVTCNSDTIMLSAMSMLSTGEILGGTWSVTSMTTGLMAGGMFDCDTCSETFFMPSVPDDEDMNFYFKWTTEDPEGPCGPLEDSFLVMVSASVIADAGPDADVCAVAPIQLDARSYVPAVANMDIGGMWIGGLGEFSDSTDPNATYTPDSSEIACPPTEVELVWMSLAPGPEMIMNVVDSNICPPVSDTMILNVWKPAEVTLSTGTDTLVCFDNAEVFAHIADLCVVENGTWEIVQGGGSLTNTRGLSTMYEPEGPGAAFSIVILRFTTDDPVGPCGPVSETIRLCLASPYLNCLANLNVSCGAEIKLEDVLVSDYGGEKFEGLYHITLTDDKGNELSNPLPIDYTGEFWIEVGTICSEKTCETTGTVTDKQTCTVAKLLDTTIWCVDEFLSIDPDSDYYRDELGLRPYGVINCGGDTIDVSYEGEWTLDFPCGDTLHQIIREWRSETKVGNSCVGHDTITVIRLPNIADYLYAPLKDTISCELDTTFSYTYTNSYVDWKQIVGVHSDSTRIRYPYDHIRQIDITDIHDSWSSVADTIEKIKLRELYEERAVVLRWDEDQSEYDTFSVLDMYNNVDGLFPQLNVDGQVYVEFVVAEGDKVMTNSGSYNVVDSNWFFEKYAHGFWVDLTLPYIAYQIEETICDRWEPNCSGLELILPIHPIKGVSDSCKVFCLSELASATSCLDVAHIEEKDLGGSCPRVVKRKTLIKQSCFASGDSIATLGDIDPTKCQLDTNTSAVSIQSFGSALNIETEQWIFFIDTVGPIVDQGQDSFELVFSTDAHSCLGSVVLPQIEVKDVCSGVKEVKATIGLSNVWVTYNDVDADGIWTADDGRTISVAWGESYPVRYEIMDSCHNRTELTRNWVSVEDREAPLVLMADTLTVTIGGKEAWLDAETFDNGSSDNCGIARILVRRADWMEACGVNVCPSLGVAAQSLSRVSSAAELDAFVAQYGITAVLDGNTTEEYYAEQYEWLMNDGAWCPLTAKEEEAGLVSFKDQLLAGWVSDIKKAWAEQCIGLDAHGNPIIELTDEFSLGGGWGSKVPVCCDDVCEEIVIEMLFVDRNCNYTRGWTIVNVEDNSIVEKASDFEELTISCTSYQANYAQLVMAAEEGEEGAFEALDEALGGILKGWKQAGVPEGSLVDYSGNVLDNTFEYVTSRCRLEAVERKVLDTAHDGEIIWKTVTQSQAVMVYDTLSAKVGGVYQLCGSDCIPSIWVELNECGVGKITRRWEVYGSCGASGTAEADIHRGNPLIFDQVIYVTPSCELDQYSFEVPNDTSICDSLGYTLDGNVDVESGQVAYLLGDSSCRRIGIGYQDEVFRIIGSEDVYKIHRTWTATDWCNNEEVQFVQKIVLNTACSTEEPTRATSDEVAEEKANEPEEISRSNTVGESWEFELFQNTPNPFIETSVVRFRLPEATKAKLTLFDLSGRVLYELEGDYQAGAHEVLISSHELSDREVSGVVFYQLETTTHSATKQMTILK